jgi:hypothetical protein
VLPGLRFVCHNLGALGGESQRNGAPDALAGARDKDDFVFEHGTHLMCSFRLITVFLRASRRLCAALSSFFRLICICSCCTAILLI